MARADDYLRQGLQSLPPKPENSAPQATKKNYSDKLSDVVALAFGAELRARGMEEARPTEVGQVGGSGAERRMAGGIGAKLVDVTWATPESGLILAISVKSINFVDQSTKNFQKNLINRRSDLVGEAVTLHRRFPYSVLGGFFFLDQGADADGTARRNSTFINAHARFRLFTGRNDPAGRDEQYERLYIVLVDANPFDPKYRVTLVGQPDADVPLEVAFDQLVGAVAERNPDFYEERDGRIVKV